MRSACNLLSQLTSLFTPAHIKEIPIIDAGPVWFRENESSFAKTASIVPDEVHCAAQKVDT